ncbi:MAG: phosphoglycerate dehydrogenase [Planctomycetota bacterium]|jgi:D-3-phosphoglycerate dehydrogenase|nr:phosphoglycerate dehydrogenase [Planctomycetota bacterium]
MKILVTSKSFARTNPAAWTRLEENGFILERFAGGDPTPAKIAARVGGVDALIVGNDRVDSEVFDAADILKVVHMHGTGLDGIDIPYATSKGVLVANAPGANRNAVAELTVAMMLNAGRGVEKHSRLLRRGEWKRTPGHEVSGSTVGLLGLGNIGRRIVELLRGFQPDVLAYDPLPHAAWARENGVRLAPDADGVFAAADFLVLALPLTEKTRHIVNARTLGLMKPSAFLINSARGGLVNDEALCAAVREKRLAGAALDAFAEEPLPASSPLREVDDIAITPHLAATSAESAAKVSEIVADDLIKILKEGRRDIAVNFMP